MIRKCLIALLALLILGGGVVQAHEAWGVTTAMAYEWAKKYAQVDVYMKMVRWAELYVHWSLLVVQQQEDNPDSNIGWVRGDFVGCTWIEVCNNFTHLRVEADFAWTGNIVGDYYISMTESGYHGDYGKSPGLGGGGQGSGSQPDYPDTPPLTKNPWGTVNTGVTEVVDDGSDGDTNVTVQSPDYLGLNLTNNHGWLYLCMKITGVDPQGARFDPTSTLTRQKIGTITLTYFPELAPDVADFNSLGSNTGTALPRYDDTINSPDVDWADHTGGIPGADDMFQPPE